MKLTPKQREVLTIMVQNRDSAEGELVCSIPGGWWLGNRRIGGRLPWALLRSCLITKSSFSGDNYESYTANGYAEKALTLPNWQLSQEIEA